MYPLPENIATINGILRRPGQIQGAALQTILFFFYSFIKSLSLGLPRQSGLVWTFFYELQSYLDLTSVEKFQTRPAC